MFSLITLAALALVSSANAADKTMTLRITCEGGCADITVNGNDVNSFPVTTEVTFDQVSDILTIKVDNGQSWIVAPKEGRHTLRIFDNPGIPTFITSETLSVLVNNPLVLVTQELVPYLTVPIAECWYEDAQKVPGTNQRNWTIHEGIGCRWMVADPEAVVAKMPKDAMLIARYGHNHTGDEGHDTPGELDTNVQAIESQARGWDIITWADTELHKELPAWPDTRASLPERKSELWVMIPKSRAAAAAAFVMPEMPEPCYGHKTMYPVALGYREVAGDKNLDGHYDAQDCENPDPVIPVQRKLRWELHGVLGLATDQFSLNVGPGIFIPVGEKDWIRFWGNIGLTPDRTTTLQGNPQGSLFDLMQFGVTHPVATWGVGGGWIGGKGLTLAVTANGYRTGIYGNSDIYDLRANVGYTRVGENHWSWYIVGGPSYEWGHAPSGQEVWAFGEFTKGPTAFRTFGFGAEGGLMYVF